MTEEEYAKHKPYAGEARPSMHRRRIGHDYTSRRMYLITITIEGRRPLLGRLIGDDGTTSPQGSGSGRLLCSGTAAAQPTHNEEGTAASVSPSAASVSSGAASVPQVGCAAAVPQPPLPLPAPPAFDPQKVTAFVEPTPFGRRVIEEWHAVTAHHPEVAVIAFQLMPDHIHGILFIQQAMEQHLGAIIRGFKTSTNKAYRQFILKQQPADFPSSPLPSSPVPPSTSVPPSASVPPSQLGVGCAAAVPQPPPPPRRDRRGERAAAPLCWSYGYNDHILSGEGELAAWRQYIADNPRRLYIRRRFPDLFRVSFNITIGPFTCTAIGNRFLLTHPLIRQVQCSTHYYEEDILKAVSGYMAAAKAGAVLVSPAISDGEKRTMRAAFDASLPQIFISPNGLGDYSKPGGAYFDACAEGRLLILSPFPKQNRKVKLTRAMCMQMNELARLIAEGAARDSGGPQQGGSPQQGSPQQSSGTAAAQPTHGERGANTGGTAAT